MKAELPVVVETCGNCRFRRQPIAEAEEWGFCHRRAPKKMPPGTSGWPEINDTDWCGEWAAIPAPAGG